MRRDRRAISGIVAALIMFVMLFTVGTGYFLWVSYNSFTSSQALVSRNNANVAQTSENLFLIPSVQLPLGPTTRINVVVTNSGNVPVVVNSILVTDMTDAVQGSPCTATCKMGVNPGGATQPIYTGYNYQSKSIRIKLITQAGNIFSTTYMSPTLSTKLSSASVPAGVSIYDSATFGSGSFFGSAAGTVDYYFSNSVACTTGTPIQVGQAVNVVNGNIPNSASQSFNTPGSYYWFATYSGDTNDAPATSACEPLTVTAATGVSVQTQLSATVVSTGEPVYDASKLFGATSNAGGTVSYEYFSGSSCTGTATPEGIEAVSSGIVPNSSPVTYNVIGLYSWNAIYSGDPNNSGATSPCEPLTVVANNGGGGSLGSLTQVLGSFKFYFTNCNPISGGSCGPSTGAGLGDGVTARGYYGYGLSFFGGTDCDSDEGGGCVSDVFQITLTNQDPQGRSISLSPQSFLLLQGVCLSEDVCVGNGDFGASFVQGYWIVDGICSPASSCTGNGAVPIPYSSTVIVGSGATVTLYFYCSGPCTTSDTLKAPASNPPPGTYLSVSLNLYGLYSDGTPFGQDIPFISSYVSPVQIVGCAAGSSFPGPSCWSTFNPAPQLTGSPGGQITLSVKGFAAQPTNPFPIYVYWVNPSGTTTVVNAATTCNNLSQPCNVTFTIPAGSATGNYGLYVTSDGANNAYATVSVLGPTTILTSLSQTTITVGSSVFDSATLSGATSNAGGQVTYEYFAGSSCQGAATNVGSPVTVTNGVVPNSSPRVFSSAGPFSWNAVYSGDGNNNGATSPCEPLTVNQASPSIATVLSTTTAPIGQPITDSATLAGASANAGGTVQFEYFTSNTCSGTPTTVGSPVTVNNGIVPTSPSQKFASPGSYGWEAVYSGDANNAGVTSPCEPLTITAAPTLTILPNQGPAGTKTTLTGSGYSNNYLYSYCLSTSAATVSCVAGSTGSFTSTGAGALPAVTTLTVPSGTAAGLYFVIVYTLGSVVQSASFNVTTATLTLTPAQGPIGTVVTLTGSGYSLNTLYAFCFSGSSAACTSGTATTFTSTGAGAIPAGVMISAPASANGFVNINQGNTGTNFIISAAFTVTTPTITLSPTQGPVATVVMVNGAGFSINIPIGSFTFNGATPAVQTCTAQTTSATGTFSCTFTVPASSNGAKTVITSGNNIGSVPADTASTMFTVGPKHVTLVQDVPGSATNASPFTCAFGSQPAVGDLVVVSFSITPSTLTVSSVRDAASNSLALMKPATQSSSQVTLEGFVYAEKVSGGSTSPITITLSGNPTSAVVTCLEFSGVLLLGPVNSQANQGTSTSSTINAALTSSMTPVANDLVYAYTGYSNCGSTSTPSVAPGFSAGAASITSGSPTPGPTCTSGSSYRFNDGDQFVLTWAGGSTTAPFTISQTAPTAGHGSSGWVEIVVEFDPAGNVGTAGASATGGAGQLPPFQILGILAVAILPTSIHKEKRFFRSRRRSSS